MHLNEYLPLVFIFNSLLINSSLGIYQTGYEKTMGIGLIYLSDYGYGASPENWTIRLDEYNDSTNNWIYSGLTEWSISGYSTSDADALLISEDYDIGISIVNINHSVRPVFYLNSDVEYISGTGTESDPFRIA